MLYHTLQNRVSKYLLILMFPPTSTAFFRSGVASPGMLTAALDLVLPGGGTAAFFLAEPPLPVGDLANSWSGIEGATMSRGTGGGSHGCISPIANPRQIDTKRDVSLWVKERGSGLRLDRNVLSFVKYTVVVGAYWIHVQTKEVH